MKNLLKTIMRAAILLGMAGSANAATLIHDYQLNTDLNDSLGGGTLVAHGGVLGGGSYSFDKNQGLVLSSSLMSADNYSIALNFNFSRLGWWQKIVDFNNSTIDKGFYANPLDTLSFFGSSVVNGSQQLTALQYATLVITRDNTLNLFSAYLNGVLAISFTDSNREAVFSVSGLNPIAHFFEDDRSLGEAAPGAVDSIRVWNGALTASEVANLDAAPVPNPVPLPGTLWLLGAALAGLSLANKHKQA